jgi:hypothetical protein
VSLSCLIVARRLSRVEQLCVDSSLESWLGAEVQQESNLETGHAEVVAHLPPIGGAQGGRGLHFDHDAILDEEIRSEDPDENTLVAHLEGALLGGIEVAQAHLVQERLAIHGLELAVAEVVVALEERTDDPTRDAFVDQGF